MNAVLVASRALMRSRDLPTSILTVLSFALPHVMFLAVTGGIGAFMTRADSGMTILGERDIANMYVILALFAGVLLIVPILSMGAAASRLGMSRRSKDLAILRLIGLGPSKTRLACVVDTIAHALVGTVIGSILYVLTLPAWSLLSFQGRAMGASEMWVGAPLLLGEVLLMALLAAVSSWIAVRRASITPLGVARSAEPHRVSKWTVAAFVVLLVAWLIGGGGLGALPTAVGTAIMLGVLAAIFAGVNAVGVWSIRILGRLMARFARRPHTLIAGRRLIDDPKSVWRSFGAVALVGFIVGFVYPVLELVVVSQPDDPLGTLIVADLRTGMLLTLTITVVLAAISTAVNQASRLVDTMNEVRFLVRAGAPDSLLDRARRAEILMPAILVIGGAMSIGLIFLTPVGIGGAASSPLMIAASVLGGFLASSILVIVVASEATRPMRARLLDEGEPVS